MTRVPQQDIEYVDVRSNDDCREPTNFYEKWLDQSSAKHATPELIAADALRKLYPGYSLIVSDDYRLASGLLTLPGITIHPVDSREAALEQVTNVVFRPLPTHVGGKVAGSLVDNTIVGSYKLTWNDNEFVVRTTHFQNENFIKTVHFVLHSGPEQSARDFLLAACLHAEQTHEEIWVFNRGNWSKSHILWDEIKDSSWDDVIMKEENKKALQKDAYGFFKSQAMYKKLSLPWKRGLIMYGPPGNGKTISSKVIMKTCTERGFTPLYVKSFQSPMGEEVAIQNVFLKTRQLAPCVLILEDLDSLVNDKNRSFFLNELDGLEGNEGLLVIASTNHFDRLDPGLSNRPSRFDRKYLFDDPDYQERMLYAKYWQEKLKDNVEISFPESLVEEVAILTQEFSFAYLKEAFVSTLVRITNTDGDERVEFSVILKDQIMTLRKELGEQNPVYKPIIQPPHIVQPENELNEQASRGKQQPGASREETSSQARDLVPHPLSMIPRANISDASGSAPMIQAIRKSPTSHSKSQAPGKDFGTGDTGYPTTSKQGHVLPAPASAYPQMMPGSLSFAQVVPIQESGFVAPRSAQVAPSASTSSMNLGMLEGPMWPW